MKYLKISSLFLLLYVGASLNVAYAADFNVAPSTGIYGVGKTIITNIKIDSSGKIINAAQGVIKFDPSILEVKSISRDGSVFNFWLQDPSFSNTSGTIQFLGGATNGVSGSSLQIMQITFNAKVIGASDISFADASITAADNTGTNVLANVNGARYSVASTSTIPSAGSDGATPPAPAAIPTPVPVTRAPTAAAGLPTIPNVEVPLYPDPDHWYNFTSQFSASWKLPSDIAAVSTVVNTNPLFTPSTAEGLFESKTFPTLEKDGVYFLHVRFRNNNGWGPTKHYRMAVDTQPPLPFKIDVPTGLGSDNPSPKLFFSTADALSGVSRYEIYVNSEPVIVASGSSYALLPKPPGNYTIRVRAADMANNSIEDSVKLEILPIATPTINSINEKIIVGMNDSLDVRGSSMPNGSIIVTIEDSSKLLVLEEEARVDTQGVWEFRLNRDMRVGDYYVSVRAKDTRGALSLPTTPSKVTFAEKAVISIFGLDITLGGLIWILVIAGAAAAAYNWRKAILRAVRSQRESVIISRDLTNAFNAVIKDLDAMVRIGKDSSPRDEKEIALNAASKKIKEKLENIEKYVSQDIERLG